MNTAGRKRYLSGHLRDILHKANGITLIKTTKIRWFSR
jgi:hypothetical protein